jgi:hypothetical protein
MADRAIIHMSEGSAIEMDKCSLVKATDYAYVSLEGDSAIKTSRKSVVYLDNALI